MGPRGWLVLPFLERSLQSLQIADKGFDKLLELADRRDGVTSYEPPEPPGSAASISKIELLYSHV
eukprot:SAG22_NODE_14_length_33165_cov_13.196698_19_plen_65_part_00